MPTLFFLLTTDIKRQHVWWSMQESCCAHKREECTFGLGNKSHCLTAILFIIDTRHKERLSSAVLLLVTVHYSNGVTMPWEFFDVYIMKPRNPAVLPCDLTSIDQKPHKCYTNLKSSGHSSVVKVYGKAHKCRNQGTADADEQNRPCISGNYRQWGNWHPERRTRFQLCFMLLKIINSISFTHTCKHMHNLFCARECIVTFVVSVNYYFKAECAPILIVYASTRSRLVSDDHISMWGKSKSG